MTNKNDEQSIPLFAGLRDKNYAALGLMVLEGRILIEKAIDSGIKLRSLLCVPADEDAWLELSRTLAEKGGRPADMAFSVKAMARPKIAELMGYAFHRGSIALAERPSAAEALPDGHALVLWNVTDPDNLGALIRSAAALGARKLYFGPGCADPFSRKALRASMGCTLSLPFIQVAGIDDLGIVKSAGNMSVAAALVEGAITPHDLKNHMKHSGQYKHISLILGNEGWGLPAEVCEAADFIVSLPMSNRVDSLNVAAAGAILMWELYQGNSGSLKKKVYFPKD
ncbi:RNA methyltransferase [Spirochaetota bacterium]